MNSEKMNTAIIGCGDFLRWQLPSIVNSSLINISYLFDPDTKRAEKFSEELGAIVASDPKEIYEDDTVELVALFVPPWLRLQYVEEAVAAGKHVITTKPLAPNADEAKRIFELLSGSVRGAVIYRRTGDAVMDTLKQIFEDEEFGRLALFKMDWLHHFPQWNTWALDPKKNGGPFMDAMIHNLNISRFLMGRPVEGITFLSENLSHPELACADTERMTVKFAGGGLADLFITWAADMAVYGTEGNDREHIEQFFMVTDSGWLITVVGEGEETYIKASRKGETKKVALRHAPTTHYDQFVDAIRKGSEIPTTLATIASACEDIFLIEGKLMQAGS